MKKSITSSEYKLFLQKLIECREEHGLTQQQLAQRIGKTQSFVSKFERGERRIDVIELIEICKAIEVSPVHFVVSLYEALSGEKNGLR